MWTGVNRCEQVWTGVNRCEQVWTGLNKSEQVWSTVFLRPWAARCPNFAYPSTKLLHLYTLQKPLNVRGITRVLWNFTRIGRKTKKLWLSIIPAWTLSEQPSSKRCELQLFLAAIRQAVRRKTLHLGSLNMQFQQDWPKDEKVTTLHFFASKLFCSLSRFSCLIIHASKLRKLSPDWALWCASREMGIFSLSQLHRAYVFAKLSISWAEICNSQQDRT